MSRRTTFVGITGLCATLAACSGSPAQSPPPPPPKPAATLPAAPVASAPVASAPAASVPTPQTVAPGTATPAPAPAAPVMATPVKPAAVSAAAAPMAAVPTAPGQAGPAQPVGSVTRAAQAPAPQAPALVPAAPPVPQSDAPAYETKGRRDPFTTLDVVTGPTGLTVATTKLTGIVRGKSTLALLETSDGIGYILRTGDTLGDGRLVEIGADNVVFALAAKPGAPPSRVVLKLAAK
jgi:hypothetical protein